MPQTPQPDPPATQLLRYITGHWVAAAIHAAVQLKIADQLRDGPKSVAELAEAAGAHPPSLYRVLRALATLGVFVETDPQHFGLTEMGQLLRGDHPQSMRSMALFQGAPPHWQGWGSLLHSVRTGQSAFAHVHGQGFFDYCQTDSDFASHFNGAMTAMSAMVADAVLEAYDFSGIRRLADVGGGHGYLLAAILRRYPELRGVVFDLPHVVQGAGAVLAEAGVAERCEMVGGSFFETAPASDGYILKHIIHDWDDEHSQKILGHIRAAMQGRGRVLLVEAVIRPDNRESIATLMDLEMLHATHGGRERSEEEFRTLLGAAGLRLKRVVETKSPFSVLEAEPV